MERMLIILAVLVCAAACFAAVAMTARGRRPPLRMGSEFDERDERLLLDAVGEPRSPIDRSAQVLDAQMLDLEPIVPPKPIAGPAQDPIAQPEEPRRPEAGR